MSKYDCYVRLRVRKVLAEKGVDITRALAFLKETTSGVVFLDNEEFTKEELENVKSFGSKSGVKSYSGTDGVGKISESPGSKLFRLIGDNPE